MHGSIIRGDYNSYKKSREDTAQAFQGYLGSFEAVKKEAEDIFKIPPQGRLSNAEYLILLTEYDDARDKKIGLVGEKIYAAASQFSIKLADDARPHRERAKEGLGTLIVKWLLDLFEGLNNICPSIPKVPDFLKTKSQDKVEEIKREATKFKRPGE